MFLQKTASADGRLKHNGHKLSIIVEKVMIRKYHRPSYG
jgi:hypothetical protein